MERVVSRVMAAVGLLFAACIITALLVATATYWKHFSALTTGIWKGAAGWPNSFSRHEK